MAWDRNGPGFGWMAVVSMATGSSYVLPSILLHHTDEFPYLDGHFSTSLRTAAEQ